eukprot:gene9029-8157_t
MVNVLWCLLSDASRLQGPFQIGSQVVVHGLTSAAGTALNGQTGTVVSLLLSSGRYRVDLGHSGLMQDIKPENLKQDDLDSVFMAPLRTNSSSGAHSELAIGLRVPQAPPPPAESAVPLPSFDAMRQAAVNSMSRMLSERDATSEIANTAGMSSDPARL